MSHRLGRKSWIRVKCTHTGPVGCRHVRGIERIEIKAARASNLRQTCATRHEDGLTALHRFKHRKSKAFRE